MVKKVRVYDDVYAQRCVDDANSRLRSYQSFLSGRSTDRIFKAAGYLSDAENALNHARKHASREFMPRVNLFCKELERYREEHRDILLKKNNYSKDNVAA